MPATLTTQAGALQLNDELHWQASDDSEHAAILAEQLNLLTDKWWAEYSPALGDPTAFIVNRAVECWGIEWGAVSIEPGAEPPEDAVF